MDAAMAFEARGDVKYGDKGNMTKEEIDKTIDKLIELKKAGHFRALLDHLRRVGQPDGLRRGGDPVDVVAGGHRGARAQGIHVRLRAAQGRLSRLGQRPGADERISRASSSTPPTSISTGTMSGWQGGFIAKQGYYSSVPETAKKFMTENEWDFWYEGKPATADDQRSLRRRRWRRPAPGARRRLVLGAHGQHRLLEHADGRGRYMSQRWNEFNVA